MLVKQSSVEIFTDFGQRQEHNLQSREVAQCDLCPLYKFRAQSQECQRLPFLDPDGLPVSAVLKGGSEVRELASPGSGTLPFVRSLGTSGSKVKAKPRGRPGCAFLIPARSKDLFELFNDPRAWVGRCFCSQLRAHSLRQGPSREWGKGCWCSRPEASCPEHSSRTSICPTGSSPYYQAFCHRFNCL